MSAPRPPIPNFNVGCGYRYAFPMFTVLIAGCSLLHHGPKIEESLHLVAVMPIERAEPRASATQTAELAAVAPVVEPGAERLVTAQVYGVLAAGSEWRFVPDLTAQHALAQLATAGDLATRARALGTAVNADAVLFGTVSRFKERVGTEYGAREPASVSLELQLLSVASGHIVWKGTFDETQRPLSSNLFNWWQFWRGGPKWFSAQEYARLGVEHLLNDLKKRLV
jgi:hypothetical protein